MGNAFYEGGSTLLMPEAFTFVVDTELKQAIRSQNYVTLILVAASRDRQGTSVAADQETLHEITHAFGKEIRDTDFLGHIEHGTLGVVLWDVDHDHSKKVINRLVSRIENYDFGTALAIAVGSATCPTHAVDLDSLKREARARPMLRWRTGKRLSPAEN
jgi:GGDEF domain-containing protein